MPASPELKVAPYGEWVSPITAALVADGGHPVSGPRRVGGAVWWTELRPTEGGRTAVRRYVDGAPADVLAAPWNARTRVHEYGGGAWTVADGGVLVFAEFRDQRLYRLDVPGGTPVPLTPESPEPGAWRYGELSIARPGEVWCVRERHAADGAITRDIAVVPLDGAAVDDPDAVRSVVGGSHFLAYPRVSPDGARLAWIAWEHPQMPWDGTELLVADLRPDGTAGPPRTLLGGVDESVLQPEWRDTDTLYVTSDRGGFWNLYLVPVDGGEPEALAPVEADIGGALWMLGARYYTPLDDGRLLVVRTVGADTLTLLDPRTGRYDDLDLGDVTQVAIGGIDGERVLLVTAGVRTASGVRELDLRGRNLVDVRLGVDQVPAAGYLPDAELTTFPTDTGREVHAVVYRPRNADYAPPDGERPPFVAFVHGGPTAHDKPALMLDVAYYTSRGIGVVDVNYGGSTGYGRAYRNLLRGQWGVVDVADTVAAVRGLAAAGVADGDRLAIEGGSAGGWTVLAALTRTDVFACGVSLFGVAELVDFVAETHDFESRYVDGLVGPLPEARALYEERAPLNHVDELSCPVLLLQGMDDPVVPPAQAERFRDALVRNRLPHAYRPYVGESHGFRRRDTIIDAHESALSFYGQVLGFTPPDVPVLELTRP